jgi:ketosteroid isomerase-like protein
MGDLYVSAPREILQSLFGEGTLRLDPQAEFDLRHPDFVMEMPQSGERIVGREAMRSMQDAFPNPPSGVVRRIVGDGDLWVVEATSDYGNDDVYHVVDILEFRDGKILKETRYYSKGLEAPEWRSAWVEMM